MKLKEDQVKTKEKSSAGLPVADAAEFWEKLCKIYPESKACKLYDL